MNLMNTNKNTLLALKLTALAGAAAIPPGADPLADALELNRHR